MKALCSSVLLSLSLLALATAAPSPQQLYPRPPFMMAQATPQRTAYGADDRALRRGLATVLPSGRPRCGLDASIVNRVPLVALPEADMGPNDENCGRKVRISFKGRTVDAVVAASCGFCESNGILIWPKTNQALVPDGSTGLLNGITWAFVGGPNNIAAANVGGMEDKEEKQQAGRPTSDPAYGSVRRPGGSGSTTLLRRPYLNIPGSALGTAPDSLSVSASSHREKGRQRPTKQSAVDDYYP